MIVRRALLALPGIILLLTLAATAGAQNAGPESIIRSYYDALNRGDLETAAARFAPGARIEGLGGAADPTAVRTFLRTTIAERTPVEIVDLQVNGNAVTWVETRTGPNGASLGPRGEAVVQSGLIQSLRFGAPIEVFGSQPATGAAPPASQPAPAAELPAVPAQLPRTGYPALLPAAILAAGLTLLVLGWSFRRILTR